MKTQIESPPTFIAIPAVGGCPAFIFDPLNRAHVRALIQRADAYFKLSAKAWEDGNNSGNAAALARKSKEENDLAAKGAALLSPLGIKCDWPGLYPSFEVTQTAPVTGSRITAHEHTTENAVLAALGHARNWLKT